MDAATCGVGRVTLRFRVSLDTYECFRCLEFEALGAFSTIGSLTSSIIRLSPK